MKSNILVTGCGGDIGQSIGKILGVRQKKFLSTMKESGSCQKNMSNILNDLGIDESNVNWFDLALCLGMDTNLFFDKYESDISIAKNIDEACLSCPVRKICYDIGVENKDYGLVIELTGDNKKNVYDFLKNSFSFIFKSICC